MMHLFIIRLQIELEIILFCDFKHFKYIYIYIYKCVQSQKKSTEVSLDRIIKTIMTEERWENQQKQVNK